MPLFSDVTSSGRSPAFDNKAAHCRSPIAQRHRPVLLPVFVTFRLLPELNHFAAGADCVVTATTVASVCLLAGGITVHATELTVYRAHDSVTGIPSYHIKFYSRCAAAYFVPYRRKLIWFLLNTRIATLCQYCVPEISYYHPHLISRCCCACRFNVPGLRYG